MLHTIFFQHVWQLLVYKRKYVIHSILGFRTKLSMQIHVKKVLVYNIRIFGASICASKGILKTS